MVVIAKSAQLSVCVRFCCLLAEVEKNDKYAGLFPELWFTGLHSELQRVAENDEEKTEKRGRMNSTQPETRSCTSQSIWGVLGLFSFSVAPYLKHTHTHTHTRIRHRVEWVMAAVIVVLDGRLPVPSSYDALRFNTAASKQDRAHTHKPIIHI